MVFVSLPGFLERAAEADPSRLAVVDNKAQLTYAELDAHANRIANTLIECGVQPGDRVVLRMSKSVWSVAGAYGVMKAGAGYVPLDVKEPADRSRAAIMNAGARVLVGEPNRRGSWGDIDQAGLDHVLNLGKPSQDSPEGARLWNSDMVAAASAERPDIELAEDSLAYILYTSGSTGKRKGVTLSHGNSTAFVNWAGDAVGLTPEDRVSSHAPMHFDLSSFDLYATARAGGTVYIVPSTASMFPVELAAFIAERAITVWYSVPTALRMLIEKGGVPAGSFPSLRTVVFAGEVFPVGQLAELMALLPHPTYWNWFGPTETNVCTAYQVTAPPDPLGPDLPIGRPASGATAFVVDELDRLVEPGERGELLITGPTVTSGYWADPERTAKVRTASPFDPEAVVFRTGDLVRENEAGDFIFDGRNDHQIKTRGYRVELGEIETFLHTLPGVSQAAVVPIPDPVITNRLHAFIAGVDCDDVAIAQACRGGLPSYMVPTQITVQGDLPHTLNGKVDRQQLIASASEEKTARR